MRVFGFLLKEPLNWFYILCFCKKQIGEAFKYEKIRRYNENNHYDLWSNILSPSQQSRKR